jgi:hypothetical protein
MRLYHFRQELGARNAASSLSGATDFDFGIFSDFLFEGTSLFPTTNETES